GAFADPAQFATFSGATLVLGVGTGQVGKALFIGLGFFSQFASLGLGRFTFGIGGTGRQCHQNVTDVHTASLHVTSLVLLVVLLVLIVGRCRQIFGGRCFIQQQVFHFDLLGQFQRL